MKRGIPVAVAIWLGLLAATLAASRRPTSGSAYPSFPSPGWWTSAYETDAEQGLFTIDADLLAVDADEGYVRVAGRRGTIIVSEDGGLTWRRETVRMKQAPRRDNSSPTIQDKVPGDPSAPLPSSSPPGAPQRPLTPSGPAGAPAETPPSDGGKTDKEKKETKDKKETKEKKEEKASEASLLDWLVPQAQAAPPPPAAPSLPEEAEGDDLRFLSPLDQRDVILLEREWRDDSLTKPMAEVLATPAAVGADGTIAVLSKGEWIITLPAMVDRFLDQSPSFPLLSARLDPVVVVDRGGRVLVQDSPTVATNGRAVNAGKGVRPHLLDSAGRVWIWRRVRSEAGGWQRAEGRLRTPAMRGLHFRDDSAGWVVGENGAVAKTTNGGKTWDERVDPSRGALNAVTFLPDGLRGWAVGDRGVVLATADGGATWVRRTRPAAAGAIAAGRRGRPTAWPMPLSWLVFGVGLVGLAPALRRRPEPQAPVEPSVADLLVSDRPLEPGAPDALGLRDIALGLSRFLRNENTTAPLTIAINGEWGTGKSSLMNLLRADLATYGFRPVWFNAWHHQKEEHLLASLLQNVRLQAVPPWWHPAGLAFRGRLLWIRGKKQIVPLMLLFSVLVGAIAVEVRRQHDPLGSLGATLTRLAHGIGEALKPKPEEKQGGADAFEQKQKQKPKPEPRPRPGAGEEPEAEAGAAPPGGQPPGGAPIDLPQLTLLVSALAALRSAWKGLNAFGVNPAQLLASASGNVKLSGLDAQTSFRQRFAADFAEVTAALGPRSMMVFIDDLDRCHPERVVEVLEAVNFLVSSGDCYVVLGMARERVEPCISLSFKNIAEEMRESRVGPSTQSAVEARTAFARQYLDKLINIEVPVPETTRTHAQLLLAVAHQPPRASALRRALARVQGFWPIAALGVAVAIGIWGSDAILEAGDERSAPAASEPANASPDAPAGGDVNSGGPAARAGAAAGPSTGDAPGRTASASIPAQTGRLEPGRARSWWPWRFLFAVVAATGAGIFGFLAFRRPGASIGDSRIFSEALDTWHGIVFDRLRTPRGLKRFLNRVRYLAMRQRSADDHPPWIERVLRRWLPVKPAAGKDPRWIPEDILVAIAALHQLDPAALLQVTAAGPPQSLADQLKRHTIVFGRWGDVETHRPAFLERVAGIQVH